MMSNFWQHCAISVLKISKKHFATFYFFVKMKLVSTVWVSTSGYPRALSKIGDNIGLDLGSLNLLFFAGCSGGYSRTSFLCHWSWLEQFESQPFTSQVSVTLSPGPSINDVTFFLPFPPQAKKINDGPAGWQCVGHFIWATATAAWTHQKFLIPRASPLFQKKTFLFNL